MGLSRRQLLELAIGLKAGLVYAVVFDGRDEVERLTTDLVLLGMAGTLLSWVPLEFKP